MSTELSLEGLHLGRRPIDLGRLRAGTVLGLMGSPDSITEVVLSAAALAGVAPPPQIPTGFRSGRLRVRRWVRTYFRAAGADPGEAALAAACTEFGLPPEALRGRLSDLDAGARAKLVLALAWATGAKWLTFIDPFAGVPGHIRTGLRARLADLAAAEGRGIVFSSDTLTDFIIAEAGVADIEKGELVAFGSLASVVSEPRGSLPAELTGVNIWSGLARKGWLSIGHSAVRARTELDGKVFVTLPWRSALVSLDEHDPAFTSAAVFEAIVVGLRDRGTAIQAKLSPVDTEMGLALDVDLADLARLGGTSAGAGEDSAGDSGDGSGADSGAGFGILHPGLGATLAQLRAAVRVGTHVFVEVDTSALRAYSVE
ncbi:ABC transporter [Brevibacterium sp. XM4083]|uniref:ABC transporter n=1 Tax=Brevibacterium sp. XM4083 TaxID=2583238 RepID=UPI00112B6798|nr:ABC transporter [Brevibacterium sp. XM4083]MCM1011034.1 ABC transporter [Brevibacterium sp. XM4083]